MDPAAFAHKPVLTGERLQLSVATEEHLQDYLQMLNDPEARALTGTHRSFTPDEIERWLRSRAAQVDRLDLVAARLSDGAFIGEAVVNEYDADNESASYRIALSGPGVFGQGYGTEMTRLVVDYVFDQVGLHRLSLEVFEHNPRAQRVYEKCGFQVEGRLRQALRWDGRRYDGIVMSIVRGDRRP
ncbi:MAG: hypothetical protein QOJ92_2338 [Frankiales bacterium]|nr:hypothetical protein [Frankiales bacterium]